MTNNDDDDDDVVIVVVVVVVLSPYLEDGIQDIQGGHGGCFLTQDPLNNLIDTIHQWPTPFFLWCFA